jgi:hypothetical protein
MNTSDILARSSFGQVDWSVIGFPIEKMLGDDLSMGADADGIDIGRAGNMKPTDPSDDVLSNAVETAIYIGLGLAAFIVIVAVILIFGWPM